MERNYCPAYAGLLALILASIATTGCQTSGEIDQLEHFAQYGDRGAANYYRIIVDGYGHNGEVSYRSGWYDARAVDALFGNIGEKVNTKAATAKRQREAVKRTYDKYMDALEDDSQFANVATYKSKYEEAVNSITGVTDAGAGPLSALDHANEKFVMIFANDPDKIIEAIRSKMKAIDLEGTIKSVFEARAATEVAENEVKLSLLARRLEGLKRSLADARTNLSDGMTNQELSAKLDALIAELETAQ